MAQPGAISAALQAKINKVMEVPKEIKDLTACHESVDDALADDNYSLALQLLGKAVFLVPNDYRAYDRRADIYAKLCDFKSAVANFKRAFALCPEEDKNGRDVEIKNKLAAALDVQGQIYMDYGEFETASMYFSEAVELNSLECNYWLHRALTHVQRKRWQAALRDVDHCIVVNSSSADIFILRAKLRWMMGSTGRGNDDFGEAQRLDPEHPEVKIYEEMLWKQVEDVYTEASQCLLKREYSTAQRLLSNALELNPSDIKVRVLRAAANRFMGNYDEALADLDYAANVYEEETGAKGDQMHAEILRQKNLTLNDMAVNCFKNQDYHRAITLFNRVIESETHGNVSAVVAREGGGSVNINFFTNRGDCYRQCGQVQQALADYHVAFDMNPEDWQIRTRLGLVHHTLGSTLFNEKNYDEAEVEFSTAIQYNPKVAHFYLHRGNTLYLQQKFEHAYKDFIAAIKLNPGLTAAQEKLDQFRVSKGKKMNKSSSSTHLPPLNSSARTLSKSNSLGSSLITENTSRPRVPENVLYARQREKEAIRAVKNIWEVPDTSKLLQDPLLQLMANGGKGPTKARTKHQYKGEHTF